MSSASHVFTIVKTGREHRVLPTGSSTCSRRREVGVVWSFSHSRFWLENDFSWREN
jgi:hypothetical protein